MSPSSSLQLRLEAAESSLAVLAETLASFAMAQNWPDDIRMHVDLVLEELVFNVISYGYPDGREGCIDVGISQDEQGIHLVVEDDGEPYDPFSQAEPDLTLPLMERPIGGLGVHFIRQFMDDHRYCHLHHRNRVELRKFLPRHPEDN